MRAPALTLALLLATGCSAGSSTATPSPSPSPSQTKDAYADLAPPTSPGVGSFNNLLANRAYEAAHGYLAAQLLEPGSLSGVGGVQLATLISGAAGDPNPAKALTGATVIGLSYRPLLAKGVTLPKEFATVVRSSYTGDEVSGLGGERALRVTWSGALHYDVLLGGKPLTFSYALKIAYVFTSEQQDPTGMTLQVTVPQAHHIAPAQTACLAKGIVLPVPGAITAVDDSAGPWPKPVPGPACPV